jgi:hypothetical protein
LYSHGKRENTNTSAHVEEQYQVKILLQKYEHLFDGTLGGFNMESAQICLQLMNHNFNPIHAREYTVPRSVGLQLQYSIEIVRLVDIVVLEEDHSEEWSSVFPSFSIPKKNGSATIRVVTDFKNFNLLLKRKTSLIYFSKDWGS